MSEEVQQEQGDGNVLYELGYHLVPTLSEEEVTAAVALVHDVIEGSGGAIINSELPSRITLAYPIEKKIRGGNQLHDSAYFGWITFEIERESLADMEEKLKRLGQLLRYLLVKTDAHYTPVVRAIEREHKKEEHVSVSSSVSTAIHKPVSADKQEQAAKETVMSDEELDKHLDELIKE